MPEPTNNSNTRFETQNTNIYSYSDSKIFHELFLVLNNLTYITPYNNEKAPTDSKISVNF